MSSISLCMIVKNEEKTLARCLNSIKKLVDEIIIVDTGSTDKTKLVASKFTNKIYDFSWQNDFSKARNYAFSKASHSYIMWLDADDVVPKKTVNYLLKIKPTLEADVYMLKYDIAFLNNKPTFSYYRERIIKNSPLAVWRGAVHECITPFGKIERINYSIWHKKEKHTSSSRNYNIYKNLIKERELSPREQYYYARELFDHEKYKQCLKQLNKFVNTPEAWTENVIDALFLMSLCYNHLGDKNNSLSCLFKTFNYDKPRANVCCHIGNHFFEQKKFNIAVYWYKQATKCKDVSSSGGFVESMYYNYYPFLQLCCCYYNLGDVITANKYNEKAGKFNNNEIIKNNRKFFEKILNK